MHIPYSAAHMTEGCTGRERVESRCRRQHQWHSFDPQTERVASTGWEGAGSTRSALQDIFCQSLKPSDVRWKAGVLKDCVFFVFCILCSCEQHNQQERPSSGSSQSASSAPGEGPLSHGG